jgi:hypothetical protein
MVDFYAPKAKIVVEVDGSQHMESKQAARDSRKNAFLASQGLRVLRFDGPAGAKSPLTPLSAKGGNGLSLRPRMIIKSRVTEHKEAAEIGGLFWVGHLLPFRGSPGWLAGDGIPSVS